MNSPAFEPAGVRRRLAAAAYDAFLVIALWMVAYVPVVMVFGAHLDDSRNPLHLAFRALLAAAFFVGFWTLGGQTLGMRAWRLKLVRQDGDPLRLADAARRCAAAALYLVPFALALLLPIDHGRWWQLEFALLFAPYLLGVGCSRFDRERRALHDRLSGTRIVRLPPA